MNNQKAENSSQATIVDEPDHMCQAEDCVPQHLSEPPSNLDEKPESFLSNGGENPDECFNLQSIEKQEIELTKRKDQKEIFSPQFIAFKKIFDEELNQEEKLQMAITFMETSLSQGDTPHFRSFWEARRLCLPLFKENISPALRSQLWAKYSEFSKEARRLKDILDEQSAFAVEQIDIAIQALEKEISHCDEQAQQKEIFELASFPQALKNCYEIYRQLQKQLNIFNTQASRINALRKELLKTEMRVRHKNKFFQRLSSAGDQIFPKRKDLIKQVSQQFSNDVDAFIEKYFGKQSIHESLFVLREEIKALQSLAKVLTLNTHSFTQTRTRLSECWDTIKTQEKERKKERAQQRVIFKQNFEGLDKDILSLKELLDKNEINLSEAHKKIENICTQMRSVELGREEVRALRDALNDVRKVIQDKSKVEEEARQQLENQRNQQKKEKYQHLKEQVDRLLQANSSQDADSLLSDRDLLLIQIHDSHLMKNEKQELERLLKPLKDIIADKKEKALLAMSEDDRQSLQQLQNILKQRKERRQEVRDQLEVLRKASGSSNLDFDKALHYKNQINEEKERLEKANHSIQEIEKKIFDLQTKLRASASPNRL